MNKRTIQVLRNHDRNKIAVPNPPRQKGATGNIETHVNGSITWADAVIHDYWETEDAIYVQLSDGTCRRMNLENWDGTFQITREKLLIAIPGRSYRIGTWGSYDPKSWFCDISAVDKSTNVPWSVSLSDGVKHTNSANEGPKVQRLGVTTYRLRINYIKGAPADGTWEYVLQHNSVTKNIDTFTRQMQIQSKIKDQGWHLGPTHDIDPNEFCGSENADFANIVKKLEQLYRDQH